MKEVDRSTIRWDVDLTPADRPEPTGIPVVADDDPWAFARQVRAAYVKTDQGEAEKYLFYRGLGAFSMPIRIKERAPNRFVVRNEGHHAVEASFLLENHANGSRFVRLGELGGNQEQLVSFEHVDRRSTGDVVAQLSNAVKSELVAAGLFEDEALAMVRTWSRSWFAGEGTRLIYVVPRRLTEQLLPMSISPAPDKLVRVLVGRLEYLSLEVENEVNAAIRDRFHTDSARSRAASARLERLGRFLEPGLRNALESKDPIVRRNAGRLLENVR